MKRLGAKSGKQQGISELSTLLYDFFRDGNTQLQDPTSAGRGNKASFWHSNWGSWTATQIHRTCSVPKSKEEKYHGSEGHRPKHVDSHVSPIQSVEELQEFIVLWEGVNTVNRMEDSEDEIMWRWTSDGQYTMQSAYQIQILGQRKKPAITPIWKAQTEPKCQIFGWILLEHKILTANNLAKHG
jgi:hypothetical protein